MASKKKASTSKKDLIQATETKAKEVKAEESKIEETKSEEIKVEETKVEETKVKETKVEESKVEETKVKETKVEESKTEENKADETEDKNSAGKAAGAGSMPVVREWKEAESGRGKVEDSELEEASAPVKKVLFGVFGIMGTALAVAVIALAVCLYGLSKELKSVQAVSASLQTDLASAEAEVSRLSLGAVAEGEALSTVTQGLTVTPKPTATPRPTAVPEQYTVCIDAGHGAHDIGAALELADGTMRLEKDDNLWIATLMQKELEAYGVKVIMTRDEDEFLELYDRTFIANSLDVDALISIHRNAFYQQGKMSNAVSGVEIWVHSTLPTDAVNLANNMLRAIKEVGGMKNRGLKYGSSLDVKEDYAINRRALMTSMIVELGFVSSEVDNAALDAYGEEYAKAMAKEVYEWLQTLN